MAAAPRPITNLQMQMDTPTTITLVWTPPSQSVLTPGTQTFKDTSGNTWGLTSAGSVTENGRAVPGGGGTSQLTIDSANAIWGQDQHTKLWWSFSGGLWHGPTSTTPIVQNITYQARYRVTGDTAWTLFPTVVSVPSVTVTGLLPSTEYDLEILASGN